MILNHLMPWPKATRAAQTALRTLDTAGRALGPLALRLLLAVEFAASGLEKWRGDNWFADIQDQFPFPFNVIPPDISWQMATWTELLGAALLVLGLGTRLASISLIVVTVVATAAVHWPAQWHTLAELAQGYAITDDGHGNYKLPLMYLVMFVPLLLQGAGVLSVDHILRRRLEGHN
jgi:putative oxidoreductase